jgi:hypothetical protein
MIGLSADSVVLGIDVVSLVIIVGMAIYGAKLLFAMKGILEKSWRYVSAGSIFLAIGVSFFAVEAIFSFSQQYVWLQDVGGLCMICGGTLILLSLREQCRIWLPKRKLARENEHVKDLT